MFEHSQQQQAGSPTEAVKSTARCKQAAAVTARLATDSLNMAMIDINQSINQYINVLGGNWDPTDNKLTCTEAPELVACIGPHVFQSDHRKQ